MIARTALQQLGLATGLLLAPLILSAALPLQNNQSMPSLAPVVKQVSPAVVNISVTGKVDVQPFNPFMNDPFFERFFGAPQMPGQREFQSAGSGVIVDANKGLVLTNHHVIENADRITVTLLDERSLEAEVIGSDKDTDIAVLKVKTGRLTAIPLGRSSNVEVGDYVIAIGNPFGFSHTVTAGIVSALGRSGINQDAYEDFIQTDASINPGNSGGALINLRGELIGINSAIVSKSGGNLGIGFAIPIDMAESIMDQLIEHGEVKRGLLGVKILSVTPDIADAYGIKEQDGALVSEVTPGSAADKSGIQAGDVIVAIDGQAVDSASELRNMIGLKRRGEKVRVGYVRDGKRANIDVVLASRTESVAQLTDELHSGLQGAEFADISKGDANFGGTEGVLIARVTPGSAADRRGLRSGDLIIKVNRTRVKTLQDFRKAIDREGPLGLTLLRGNSQLLIPIL